MNKPSDPTTALRDDSWIAKLTAEAIIAAGGNARVFFEMPKGWKVEEIDVVPT